MPKDARSRVVSLVLNISLLSTLSIASSFAPDYTRLMASHRTEASTSRSVIHAADALNEGGNLLNKAERAELTPGASFTLGTMGPNSTSPGFLRRLFPNFPWHRLPDYLTYIRCATIPAMVVFFYRPKNHVSTASLFAFASFTDWLDGFLARRWDITSAFGAFLDPVADKLMVSTSMILLTGRYGAVVAAPTAIILAREIAVSALREWMASRGQRNVVQVGFQGKLKTALSMMAITLMLLVPDDQTGTLHRLYGPALGFLYLCAAIAVSSGNIYFKAALPILCAS